MDLIHQDPKQFILILEDCWMDLIQDPKWFIFNWKIAGWILYKIPNGSFLIGRLLDGSYTRSQMVYF